MARFTYDEKSRRYRNPRTGRWVSNVRGILDQTLDKASKDMRTAAQSLRDGKLSLTDFRQVMRDNIKSSHLASTALAKGGWEQMTQADYGRAGQRIRQQYGLLENMVRQIEAGQQKLDGTLLRRSEMYMQAGRGTYHDTERVEMARRGVTEMRSKLGQADHCEECVSQSELGTDGDGWVPIDYPGFVRIGSRLCKTNCHCEMQYRGGQAA